MERAGKLVEKTPGELAGKVSRCRMQITGLSPVGNGFSLSLWDFSLRACLPLQPGCGERRRKGCSIRPSARKELTELTAEQVGRDSEPVMEPPPLSLSLLCSPLLSQDLEASSPHALPPPRPLPTALSGFPSPGQDI